MFLLRNPITQTVLARIATSYLTNKLNTEISIGKLEIKSFRNLSLKTILIKDLQKDTLICAGNLSVNIKRVDSEKNILKLKQITLTDADIRLRKYKDSTALNFQFIIDYFGTKDTVKKQTPEWILEFDEVVFSNSKFVFNDQNKKPKHTGINFYDIGIRNLNLDIENVVIDKDTISADINHLSVIEKSGFIVDSLSCNFKISPKILQAQNLKALTQKNDLDLDFKFVFDSFRVFDDFINKVHIQTQIRPSIINLGEVGYFAPIMFAMDNRMRVSGKIKGTVNNFKAKDFKFGYGKLTQFRGNIQMNGLPDIKETYSHLSINDFITSVEDVREFRIPTKDVHIDLPEMLTRLGKIRINGKFTGFYNDFVSYANFKTEIGQINTDILLRVNKDNNIEYKGEIEANNFNAGTFFTAEKYLGRIDMRADITGSGVTSETIKINMNGIVDSLEFYEYEYHKIIISGDLIGQKFSGSLNVKDENINLDFDGIIDYSKNTPSYNFIADIKDANLHKINLVNRNSTVSLSTTLNFDFRGDRLDNMQGIIIIDSTVYAEQGEKYFMKDFTLSIVRDSIEFAMIRLFSDIVDASIEGKFLFKEMPVTSTLFFNYYLDTLFQEVDLSGLELSDQDFIFDIELKNTTSLSKLFIPELKVAPGTKITGGYNSRINNLFLEGESPEIEYLGKIFKDWFIKSYIKEEELLLSTGCNKLFFSDTINIDSLNIICKARNDSVLFDVSWNNLEHEENNYGDLNGHVVFYNDKKMELRFNHADVMISDSLWAISPDNFLLIDSNNIHFHDIAFRSNNQDLRIDGKVSDNPLDTLLLSFNNFNLSNFDLILKKNNFELDGFINGSLKIADYYKSSNYLSDIEISDFHFNKEKLGDAVLKTTWDPQNETFDILGEIIYTGNIGKSKTLEVTGTYFPKSTKDNFNIDIKLNNYKLITIEPLVRSFSSKVKGLATGIFQLRGTKQKPVLTGELSVMRTQMHIDYLNVSYYFADKIYFEKNLIYFNNITIYDSLNNQAICSGKIQHDYLRDFTLNLNFNATDLVGLNTTKSQNNIFYGKAFATGKVKIFGPPDNLNLDINVKSKKGTNVKIPLSSSTEVTQNDYIIFINTDQVTAIKQNDYNVDNKGITLNLDLNVTQDAEIQIFLPYQMGNLRGNGNGELKMDITPSGKFTMNGEYIINRGSFFLTLQNIINRNFDIRRGGRIIWTGDPYDAQISLEAVYKIKTTLGEYGPPEDSATRVNVDCVIVLKNKLLNPEIEFNIEFPNMKDDEKQYVYSKLDTTDQAMMSQQMLSLLVLNSFSYSSGYSGSVGFNTFSLLTNQLNNWLSQISNDFDIGINYRPGDEISSQEVEVALSTQLFDDRVSIDGNVGVRGSEDAKNTNDIVGEVTVEVKITQDGRLRGKAFNISNNNYLYNNYAPYTQGIGIFYTQEFNKLSDLFGRKRKKSKPEKE